MRAKNPFNDAMGVPCAVYSLFTTRPHQICYTSRARSLAGKAENLCGGGDVGVVLILVSGGERIRGFFRRVSLLDILDCLSLAIMERERGAGLVERDPIAAMNSCG